MKNILQFKIITSTFLLIAILLIYLFSIIMLVSGCKKTDSTPAPNEVWMQGNAFTPATITITVNTTVKWTNKDGVTHTVTSDTGLWDSGSVTSNGTYSRQFTTAGTYPYHCIIHSMMTGTVIVH